MTAPRDPTSGRYMVVRGRNVPEHVEPEADTPVLGVPSAERTRELIAEAAAVRLTEAVRRAGWTRPIPDGEAVIRVQLELRPEEVHLLCGLLALVGK